MTAAISPFIAPPVPQAQPQAAAPTNPANTADGFAAKLLRQRQAMAHESAPAKPSAPAEKHAETEPSKAGTEPQAATAATQADAAEASDKADPGADKKTDDASDPALADWMSALNLPPAPTVPAEATTAAGQGAVLEGSGVDAAAGGAAAGKGGRTSALKGLSAGAADANAAATATATATAAPRGEAGNEPAGRVRAAREGHDKPEALHAEAPSHAAGQAAVEQAAEPEERKSRGEVAAPSALGGAAAAAPSAKPAEAAAPTVVNLPTPATAAEFPKELGVQISVLAKAGVQTAELHLNPAEMGPISVQIALDGTQAQVNFGADSAATRQIIEGGLPELASALRDAGFTLSGGGVHQGAQGRREGGNSSSGGDGSGRGNSVGEVEAPTRRSTARVSAGGVDLYA